MSATLREINLIDHCTPSISYDRQVQAGCTAFDKQMYQIIDVTPVVIFIPAILTLADSNLVDILAWQFHVDFYDHTKPLDFRRRLVQNSIQWHMRKGTVALVQEVLDTFWPGGATLTEWFEYDDPLPPNYPIVDDDTLIGSLVPANVNVTTDTFTKTAHGLANGAQVHFELTPAGSMELPDVSAPTLPAPLLAGILYRVINATTNTFKVSPSLGGAPVDLTTAGSGTFYLFKKGTGSWHDRYRFRVYIDETIINPDDEAQVLRLINAYKPVSRWLEGLFRSTLSDCAIGWYGACLQFYYISSDAPTFPAGGADIEVPDAPVLDTLTPGYGTMTLDWTPPVTRAPIGGYVIYRSTVSGGYDTTVQVKSDVTSYVDSAVAGGVTYFYRVAAIADGIEGVPSNEMSDVTLSPPALLNGLVSYWKLDDAVPGPYLDSIGTNHLTQIEPAYLPTSAPGKIGNALRMTGAYQAVRVFHNASLQPAGDFAFAAWVWMDDAYFTKAFIAKGDAQTTFNYILLHVGAQDGGTGFQFNGAVWGAIATINAWHHLMCWHDAAAGMSYLQVDFGDIKSGAFTPVPNTKEVFIGTCWNGPNVIWQHAGFIDEIPFWHRIPTAAERAAVWNGGAGLPLSAYTM